MHARSSQPSREQAVSSSVAVTWSLSQGAEEGAYVFDQGLWLFHCCEMSSGFHLCPSLDIVVVLRNRSWGHRDFLREHSHACRNLNPARIGFTLLKGLIVETRRGVDGLRDPKIITLVSSSSLVNTLSRSPWQSLQARNFSMIQPASPTGESFKPYASVWGRVP